MNIVHKRGVEMPKVLESPRETILMYAKEIVNTKGIEHLTMREVSIASGIAVGTIYNYFPTKKALTFELIENYWYDYLLIVDKIDKTEPDLFLKLFKIYEQMNVFVKTFKEIWVKNLASEHTPDGIAKKDIFVDKLSKKIEFMLIEAENNKKISLSILPNILAKFLILNFIMMAQMQSFNYEDFNKILVKLFS